MLNENSGEKRLNVPHPLLKAALWIFVGEVTRDRCDQDVYVIALSSFRTLATTVETSAQWFL